MPSTLTYPGVYIEEVPSGVRTITGVATSITAFVGRAARGPVERADHAHELRRLRAALRRALTRLSALAVRRPRLLPERRQPGARRPPLQRRRRPDERDDRRERARCSRPQPGSWGNALRARVETGPAASRPTSRRSGRRSSPASRRRPLQPDRPRHGDRRATRSTGTSPSSTARAGSTRCSRTSRGSSSRTAPPAYPTTSHADAGPGEDIWDPTLTLSSPVDTDGLGRRRRSTRRRSPGRAWRRRRRACSRSRRPTSSTCSCIPPYTERRRRRRHARRRRRGVLRAAPRDADRRPAARTGTPSSDAVATASTRVGTVEQERGALLPAPPAAEPAARRPDRELRAVRRGGRRLRAHRRAAAACGRRRPGRTRRSSACRS